MKIFKDAHCTEIFRSLPAVLKPQTYPPLLLALLTSLALMASPSTVSAQEPAAPASPDSTPATAAAEEDKQAPEPPPYRSSEERSMKLLEQRIDPEVAIWLNALNEPFLSLFERDLTGNPVGALLIINAEGQHSNWPGTSERIRLSLPEYGWNTLSVELPEPRPRPIPPRSPQQGNTSQASNDEDASQEPNDEAPPETDKESEANAATEEAKDITSADTAEDTATEDVAETPQEVIVPVEDIAQARLKQTLNFLQSQGQFNIVVMGSGIGAIRAAHFIQSLPANNGNTNQPLIRALILVNARNRIPESNLSLQHSLNFTEVPVLDLFIGDTQRHQQEARERLKWARRNNFTQYTQLQLPPMAHNALQGENRLSRRIRGFLEKHARGVKVDNAIIR